MFSSDRDQSEIFAAADQSVPAGRGGLSVSCVSVTCLPLPALISWRFLYFLSMNVSLCYLRSNPALCAGLRAFTEGATLQALGFTLMKILKKWSHWSCVWFLTALLCFSAAICSPYSHISVVWGIKRDKLESGSLIHSCTTSWHIDQKFLLEIFLSQAIVVWWLLSAARQLFFISDTCTFIQPFPHQLGPFIPFASSTRPIIVQRPLFVLQNLSIRSNQIIYFWEFPLLCGLNALELKIRDLIPHSVYGTCSAANCI